jgi:transglutaminase-like putative cysteine protease
MGKSHHGKCRGAVTMKTERCLSVVLILILLLGSEYAQADGPALERWHVLTIDGAPVGSMHEIMAEGDDCWHVSESTVMVINRLDTRIETSTVQETVETVGGVLESVRLQIQMSDQVMSVEALTEDGEWVTRDPTPGVPERRQTLSEPLTGPRAIAGLLAGLNEPGDQVSYSAFIPYTMQPGSVSAELVGFETVGEDSLRVIEEHLPGLPAPLVRLIGEDGRNVMTRMPGPFGLMKTTLADETAAILAQSGGDLPDEVFEDTILKTGVRLPSPRRMEYLELELRHRNPALGWPDFNSNHQRVLDQTNDRLVLAVERRHPRQSVPLTADVDDALGDFLQPNSLLQVNQPELIELARSITANADDRWQAALMLEQWVAENLSFDMGVVLASSSEVLANRRGTCTEYAVLLTALARAVGIPARYVTGYVYAHGMLAGHAWTEVKIGEDWLAIDAAIPADGPADAARFAFLWTDLNIGIGELNAGPVMQMFGQIEARVLAWRVADSELERYPDQAPLPEVSNGRFVDPVQGIAWTLPEGWSVVDHDQTWPSNLIAAAVRSDGAVGFDRERVELRWVSHFPWERAGRDWIQSRAQQGRAGSVEAAPFGLEGTWLVEHDQGFDLVQPGPDGLWQLRSSRRELLAELVDGLELPVQ